MVHVFSYHPITIVVIVQPVTVERIVNTVKTKKILRKIIFSQMHMNLDITDCSFPFVDNQNRTHNSCITTSDYLSGTVAWCRTITGQQKSCESMR